MCVSVNIKITLFNDSDLDWVFFRGFVLCVFIESEKTKFCDKLFINCVYFY